MTPPEPDPGWWIVQRRDGRWTAFRDRDAAVLLSTVVAAVTVLPTWSVSLPHG